MFLSLQGSMAVGKTTVLKNLSKEIPEIEISYEENQAVIQEIHRKKLDKENYEDFLEIQRLFIENEVKRYQKYTSNQTVIMDFGSEEILFHTLTYPKILGKNWPVEKDLKEELMVLRNLLPAKILYLQASLTTLQERKQQDNTRSRTSFDFYVEHFLPIKENYFLEQEKVDVLKVDDLSKEEVTKKVNAWIKKQQL